MIKPLLALALVFTFFGAGIHVACPIQSLTGLPCPGCNMTTAFYYLLHGDLKTSLFYHALLLPTMLTIGVALLLYKKRQQKALRSLLIVWCILMIGYYGYRMAAIFPDVPMVFDQNSLLSLLIHSSWS